MSDSDLEARVSALEAKEEVRAFIADYCTACDKMDTDELLELFVDEAVMRNPAGVHDGREAIRRYYADFYSGGTHFSRHHAVNQVITVLAPGRARHQAYFLAMLGRDGESKVAFGRYDDIVVKRGERWQFEEKVNDVLSTTSLGAGWAQGLPVAAPIPVVR